MAIARPGSRLSPLILIFSLFPIIFSGCQAENLCNDAIGCIVLHPGAKLNIGVDKSTTGAAAGISQTVLAALNFASNQKLTLNGHPINVFFQESSCNDQPHLKVTSLFTSQPDLAAVFGPICQSETGKFAKLISDAGLILFSPAPLIDSSNQSGWYRVFPTLYTQAAAIQKAITAKFQNQGLAVVVQNQEIDLQVANMLCGLYKANNLECNLVITLDNNADDPAAFENLSQINKSAVILVISPFNDFERFSSLADLRINQSLIFFDPELAPIPTSLPLFLQNSYLLTTRQPQNAETLIASLPPDQAAIYGLFAFDAYQILMKALAVSSQVTSDGTMVIPRQGLREAVQQMGKYDGMMVGYQCQTTGICLDPENLLILVKPDQKDNP